MPLIDYWRSLTVPERKVLAALCETSVGFLQNVAYGYRACGAALASDIERATDGAVRRWELRPDDWHRIWPELLGVDGAPTPAAQSQQPA